MKLQRLRDVLNDAVFNDDINKCEDLGFKIKYDMRDVFSTIQSQ